jgi:hypothetical protein
MRAIFSTIFIVTQPDFGLKEGINPAMKGIEEESQDGV